MEKPKVLFVSDKEVRIEIGPYIISFVQEKGKVKKKEFLFEGQVLESSFIPPEYYNPAVALARRVFWSRLKRKQKRKLQLKLEI